MKISDVLSIVKKKKYILLAREGDQQWCSDGYAAYNISSLPAMDKEQFLALLSVEEEKKSEYKVDFNDTMLNAVKECSRSVNELVPLDRGNTLIHHMGNLYEPLIVKNRVVFLNTKYLKPFDKVDYELYAKAADKLQNIMIVVKAGFFTMGIIMPTAISTDAISVDLSIVLETLKRQKELEELEPVNDDEEDDDKIYS